MVVSMSNFFEINLRNLLYVILFFISTVAFVIHVYIIFIVSKKISHVVKIKLQHEILLLNTIFNFTIKNICSI